MFRKSLLDNALNVNHKPAAPEKIGLSDVLGALQIFTSSSCQTRLGAVTSRCIQGIGRHSYEYVLERLDGTLAACAALLDSSGAYLTGGEAVQADLFLFAVLESVRSSHVSPSLPPPLGCSKPLLRHAHSLVWFPPHCPALLVSLIPG